MITEHVPNMTTCRNNFLFFSCYIFFVHFFNTGCAAAPWIQEFYERLKERKDKSFYKNRLRKVITGSLAHDTTHSERNSTRISKGDKTEQNPIQLTQQNWIVCSHASFCVLICIWCTKCRCMRVCAASSANIRICKFIRMTETGCVSHVNLIYCWDASNYERKQYSSKTNPI